MKTLFRTLVILAAALVVVAGVYAFGRSSFAQGLRAGGPGRGDFGREGGPPPDFFRQGLPDGPPGGFGEHAHEGREGRGGHGGHGPSLFGLVEVAKNLALIALSVLVVALGARLLGLTRRGRTGAEPPRSAPTG